MKTVMNITTCCEDTDRYQDLNDLWKQAPMKKG